jgi:hypothetical protein
MKNYIFLSLLFCLPFAVSAQKDGDDTVRYSVLVDDPGQAYFGIGPSYNMSINNYNFTLAAFGLSGFYNSELFAFQFNSRYHLGERLADFSGNETYAQSIYEPEHSRDIEALATYYFKSDNTKGTVRIQLDKRGNTEVVTDIPARIQTRYGVDLGFMSGVTYYNFQESVVLNGVDNAGNTAQLESINEKGISSYYKYSFLKIGANRTWFTNLVVKTDKYGRRQNSGPSGIYAQAFIGLAGTLDDVFIPYDYSNPDVGPYTQYEINSVGFNRLGGCIGYYTYGINKMGVGWSGEIGLFPGPKTNIGQNVYLDLKLHFHFAKHL